MRTQNDFIPIFEPYLTSKEKKYVSNCLNSNWISSQGGYIKEFEERLAKIHSVKHCVATSSCTTAIHLSLSVLGIKEGDEVICPALSFIAPANMILLTKAKLVLVDIDPITLNIDTNKIEKFITKKTKAIIFVNQFGQPANINELIKISRKYKLKLIEDNAEAFMGTFNNKKLGSFGDMSVLSFFANKIITTGEGGAVLTNSLSYYNKLLVMRDHGMSREKKYKHISLGFNYRMTNMQAGIGLGQLDNLGYIIKKRQNIFKRYYKLLKDNTNFNILNVNQSSKNANWFFTIILKNKQTRNKLLNFLIKHNIETRPMISPIYKAKHIKKLDMKNYPITEIIYSKCLHLPSSTNLKNYQIEKISETIKKFFI